jgi:hypothetical protein
MSTLIHWYAESELPQCTEVDHDHQRFDVHQHRSEVVLPDGTVIAALSFDDRDPYDREFLPAFGLYLDRQWQPPWAHEHLDWPDFGVPDDAAQFAAALRSLLDRARKGDWVEVGCLGGHGRTGTALACLAILCGEPPGDAISWVRVNYCADAVETLEQEAFVVGFGG